jgi:hypothetical protein
VTFEPDEDVLKILEEVEKGRRSKIINQAMRKHGLIILKRLKEAERQLREAQTRYEKLIS